MTCLWLWALILNEFKHIHRVYVGNCDSQGHRKRIANLAANRILRQVEVDIFQRHNSVT